MEANKKRRLQKDKKRKRDEDGGKEDTEDDEELSINDGEKVFTKSRTGKAHYLEIIKEMSYIKGMPPALLFPKMIEWVLACEVKRSKSKNINGTLARQREYLIKLYCIIDEIKAKRKILRPKYLENK